MRQVNAKERIGIGFKAHSGWAAAVTIAFGSKEYAVVDRRRIELTEKGEYWAKQPYHAAEELDPASARRMVKRGITSADRVARSELGKLFAHIARLAGQVAAAAVLIPAPMPDWSIDEILSVHPRMHKAEGVLFPASLCNAIEASSVKLIRVPEKQIEELAEDALKKSFQQTTDVLMKLGKSIGPPWGKDQKLAAIAAMIALASA